MNINSRLKNVSLLLGICSTLACASAGEQETASAEDSFAERVAAYDQPESPTVQPGSLRIFDVLPTGEFIEHERANLSLAKDEHFGARIATSNVAEGRVAVGRERHDVDVPTTVVRNWDWGDEGVYSPSNSGSAIEVEDLLNPGQVMMGIGARCGTGGVSRMRLRAISIRNDWSWDPVGATWQDWVRTPSDDGSNQPELELAISRPFVVVGVGMGITNHNVKVIRLRKREYSPTLRRLTGPEYEDALGTGPGELYWDTGFVTQTASQKEKMVVVGVGLREYKDNLRTLRVWTAYLD